MDFGCDLGKLDCETCVAMGGELAIDKERRGAVAISEDGVSFIDIGDSEQLPVVSAGFLSESESVEGLRVLLQLAIGTTRLLGDLV